MKPARDHAENEKQPLGIREDRWRRELKRNNEYLSTVCQSYVVDMLLERHNTGGNNPRDDGGGGDDRIRQAHVEDELHDWRWQGLHAVYSQQQCFASALGCQYNENGRDYWISREERKGGPDLALGLARVVWCFHSQSVCDSHRDQPRRATSSCTQAIRCTRASSNTRHKLSLLSREEVFPRHSCILQRWLRSVCSVPCSARLSHPFVGAASVRTYPYYLGKTPVLDASRCISVQNKYTNQVRSWLVRSLN
jgi:hypothetical protein